MQDSSLVLPNYKHFHVYYLINPHDDPGKLMIYRSGDWGSEKLSNEPRIVQWKSGRKRTQSRLLSLQSNRAWGPGSETGWARGKVSEVLGDVKRGLYPKAESQGLSLGERSGQASCPQWALLCTLGVLRLPNAKSAWGSFANQTTGPGSTVFFSLQAIRENPNCS